MSSKKRRIEMTGLPTMMDAVTNNLSHWQLRREPHLSACSSKDGPFKTYGAAFKAVLGSSPSLHLLARSEGQFGDQEGLPLFHEAGVYVPSGRSGSKASPGDVWITSNLLEGGKEKDKVDIWVCRISLPPAGKGAPQTESEFVDANEHGVFVAPGVSYKPTHNIHRELVMANGATAWGNEILFCSQGQDMKICDDRAESIKFHPSQLVAIDPRDSDAMPRIILNNFHGRVFNSLNDVCVHRPNGCLFFTDPDYGYEQGFKSAPQLPNAVWRFDPKDGSLGMVADGLKKPNGIVFSPDGETCYVTDTDFIHGDGDMNGARAGTIYAYDVRTPPNSPPQLHNKRVFAFVDCGAPDGIKCDEAGNVYTGCFDGVHVFAPSGLLIGKILLPPDDKGRQRGCANLVFGPPGRLIILSETTVWEARIAAVGDLKGVELA